LARCFHAGGAGRNGFDPKGTCAGALQLDLTEPRVDALINPPAISTELRPAIPRISIRRAETDDDVEAVRSLCRAWPEWQLKIYPDLREVILNKFEPVAYGRLLADLPQIHARPKGAMMLAHLDGRAVGCVMHDEMAPGVAEVKRLFVDEGGRGHGLGRALLNAMFAQMRSDGYAVARFSSARFLTHARRLYESAGFVDIAQPDDLPASLRDVVYFMERPL
jgi:GNAT superfamily N-acetyltransferase